LKLYSYVLPNNDEDEYYRQMNVWQCRNCNIHFLFDAEKPMSIVIDMEHETVQQYHDKICEKIKNGEISY
jgi:hypothetical protein